MLTPGTSTQHCQLLVSQKYSYKNLDDISQHFMIFITLQGDCWICMELMSISLDKFYKYVYGPLQSSIPEDVMGKITVAVSASFCLIHFPFFLRLSEFTSTNSRRILKSLSVTE